jgi:zinc protease
MKTTSLLRYTLAAAVALGISAPAFAQTEKQAPPAGGPPKPFVVPKKQTFTLPNGIQVTMVPYGATPKVTVNAFVRAGNINEGPNQVWLADITGELLKEGTKTRSATQVAREAAEMGGSIAVAVGPDQTSISSDVLSEFGPKAAVLLADVIQHPLLPASELPRLKNDATRRLTIAKSQPQQMAQERFAKLMYPNHAYGRIFPTSEMIDSYKIEDVQKFYSSNFGAARTAIYVAGKFDPVAMRKAITAGFSGWAKGPAPKIDIPKTTLARGFDSADRPGAQQSTVYVGLPVVDPSNADYIPLIVSNALLGGSFGSRMTANLREAKGYTYSPFSQLNPKYRTAYWVQVADVTTNVTGPSLKEIFYEIDRLQKEAPSEEEMSGLKNYLAGIFVLRNSNRQGLIQQLRYVDLHQLGDDYLNTYVQKIYAVKPVDVQAMAKKYLQADKMAVVVVGDQSKISDQIAQYKAPGGGGGASGMKSQVK